MFMRKGTDLFSALASKINLVRSSHKSCGSWLACEEDHAVCQQHPVKPFAGKPAPTESKKSATA
jgi:hypothetical protein